MASSVDCFIFIGTSIFKKNGSFWAMVRNDHHVALVLQCGSSGALSTLFSPLIWANDVYFPHLKDPLGDNPRNPSICGESTINADHFPNGFPIGFPLEFFDVSGITFIP